MSYLRFGDEFRDEIWKAWSMKEKLILCTVSNCDVCSVDNTIKTMRKRERDREKTSHSLGENLCKRYI